MKLKIIAVRIFVALLLILALVLLLLPFTAKKIIENKSSELIGRKITIGDLDLNYATFTLSIDDFILYKQNGTDPFVSFKTLRIDMEPWRLLKKEYALSEFFWDGLSVAVSYDGEKFNFDDLIPEEDTTIEQEPSNKQKKEVHYSFENINIVNGSYEVADTRLNKTISGKNINFKLPVLAWNNNKSEVGFNIDFGRQGGLSVDADFDQKAKEYWVKARIDSLLINPLAGYIGSYINTSDIHGTFHNRLNVHGSLGENANVVVSGDASIRDFVLNDSNGDTIISTEELYVRLDSIDVLNQYYHVGAVKIIGPLIHYEQYDSIHSNITELMTPVATDSTDIAAEDSLDFSSADTTFVAGADSIAVEETTEATMYYLVDSVMVLNGKVTFIDKSLDRNFYYLLQEINMAVTGLDNEADRIPATISMKLNEEGSLSVNAGFSIKEPLNIDAQIELRKLDLVSFSPYTEYFIARPIHQGRMIYLGDVDMTKDTIVVQNDIWIRELEFGERVSETKRNNTPVRIALNILKDKNDNVEMHVPISGNPSDPGFKVGKMVWGAFSGFLGKIAAKPGKFRPHFIGKNPNKIEKIKLEPAQQHFTDKNKRILDKIGNILKKEERKQSRKKEELGGLMFTLTQEPLIELEKKELAVHKVCHDYMQKVLKPASPADSTEMITTLLKERSDNSGLVEYINQQPVSDKNIGFEEKCVAIVGDDKLTREINALIKTRNKGVENYLLEELGVDKSRIEVRTTDLLNFRPEFDVPIFRVESAVLMVHEQTQKD